MARARIPIIDDAAVSFGRLIARYSLAAITPTSTDVIIEAPLAPQPTVLIAWHESNLLALALHGRIRDQRAMAFVPPGLSGAAMRGWLEILGVTPVPLGSDAMRGLGLRQMEAALGAGQDVLIAVDGPCGPRHRIAPGAIWLARAAGVQIRPVGCIAWPCLRLPRWDRLILPLPGGRTAIVIGAPLSLLCRRDPTGETTARVGAELNRVNAVARLEITSNPGLKVTEVAR